MWPCRAAQRSLYHCRAALQVSEVWAFPESFWSASFAHSELSKQEQVRQQSTNMQLKSHWVTQPFIKGNKGSSWQKRKSGTGTEVQKWELEGIKVFPIWCRGVTQETDRAFTEPCRRLIEEQPPSPLTILLRWGKAVWRLQFCWKKHNCQIKPTLSTLTGKQDYR